MQNRTQRVLAARAVTVTLTACATVAGYLLSCVLAIQLAENWLDQYAKLVAVQEEASSTEAHALLLSLKKSPYPACSDAEIAHFRELVFRSDYLKDVGRMRGGNIECSATVGRGPEAIRHAEPGIPLADGTIAYNNLVPLRDDHVKREGLQLGSAYVVFGSHMPASLGPMPMSLTVTLKDTARPASGEPAGTAGTSKAALPGTDGTSRIGDRIYATRCSVTDSNCVTASAPVTEAMQGERNVIAGGTSLGTLAGLLLSLALVRMRSRSLSLEQQLRRAIALDKLQVYYQPIVSLATGRIEGAEALTRWTNEEGAPVSPDVFIKIAEENGFVGLITKLVVRHALNDFAETLAHRPDFRLNVNVAAADLADPKFLPMLDNSIDRANVPPNSLAIEITESSTADREVAMESIRLLRRRGHSIYIDDFGTGYSSLSYLLYLSVDTIKIDKAFTRAIGTESVTVAILPQIMAMAKSLNLDVVVEGIETDQQALYFSTAQQRVYGQGWLYGRPIPINEFRTLLAENWRKAPACEDAVETQAARAGGLRVAHARTA
jgi:sensor c-di-GMP phosphodiesterase-like protein